MTICIAITEENQPPTWKRYFRKPYRAIASLSDEEIVRWAAKVDAPVMAFDSEKEGPK